MRRHAIFGRHRGAGPAVLFHSGSGFHAPFERAIRSHLRCSRPFFFDNASAALLYGESFSKPPRAQDVIDPCEDGAAGDRVLADGLDGPAGCFVHGPGASAGRGRVGHVIRSEGAHQAVEHHVVPRWPGRSYILAAN